MMTVVEDGVELGIVVTPPADGDSPHFASPIGGSGVTPPPPIVTALTPTSVSQAIATPIPVPSTPYDPLSPRSVLCAAA